jgi:hypothetical protein
LNHCSSSLPYIELLARLRKFEQRLGVQLPRDYREYLLGNGLEIQFPLCVDFVGVDGKGNSTTVRRLFGIQCDTNYRLEINYDFYVPTKRVPEEVLPIANDIGDNLLCIGLHGNRRGNICYWDHEFEVTKSGTSNLVGIFPSFEALIHSQCN